MKTALQEEALKALLRGPCSSHSVSYFRKLWNKSHICWTWKQWESERARESLE